MITRIAAFVAVALGFASLGRSQVIYLPVQYQHGDQFKYYYGGTDPLRFERAERESALLAYRPVEGALPRVYSDLLPFVNGYVYGMDPSYAYNQAYQSVPRYFRKRELLQSGYYRDGALVVPPAPTRVPVSMDVPVMSPEPSREKKGVILIIPRKPAPRQTTTPVLLVDAQPPAGAR